MPPHEGLANPDLHLKPWWATTHPPHLRVRTAFIERRDWVPLG